MCPQRRLHPLQRRWIAASVPRSWRINDHLYLGQWPGPTSPVPLPLMSWKGTVVDKMTGGVRSLKSAGRSWCWQRCCAQTRIIEGRMAPTAKTTVGEADPDHRRHWFAAHHQPGFSPVDNKRIHDSTGRPGPAGRAARFGGHRRWHRASKGIMWARRQGQQTVVEYNRPAAAGQRPGPGETSSPAR